jgi:hypothetical protein
VSEKKKYQSAAVALVYMGWMNQMNWGPAVIFIAVLLIALSLTLKDLVILFRRRSDSHEVEIKSAAEDKLLIRFLDSQRSEDDLPEIVFGGKTWEPYYGKRVTNTSTPGYYVQYGIRDSMASQLKRIGHPNGQQIGLEAKHH